MRRRIWNSSSPSWTRVLQLRILPQCFALVYLMYFLFGSCPAWFVFSFSNWNKNMRRPTSKAWPWWRHQRPQDELPPCLRSSQRRLWLPILTDACSFRMPWIFQKVFCVVKPILFKTCVSWFVLKICILFWYILSSRRPFSKLRAWFPKRWHVLQAGL